MKKKTVAKQSRSKARAMNGHKHQKRRKQRIILVNLLLILFVLIGAAILIVTMFFKVNTLKVEGSSQYSYEQIVEKSGLAIGINIFDFDLSETEEKIGNALPNLDKVNIERQLPSTVIIKVQDTKPAANVKKGNNFILIDQKGKVLMNGNTKLQDGLPVIKGLHVQDVAAGDYLDDDNSQNFAVCQSVMESIDKYDIRDIQIIDLTDDFNLKMLYQNRMLICLGTDSELDYKCKFVKKMIDEKLSAEETGIMDASVSGRVSIRNQDITGLIDMEGE